MKNFAVAYGMARRSKNMHGGGPVMQTEESPEDMIQAIIAKRKGMEEPAAELESDFEEAAEALPDPGADRRARIAKLLGR